MRQDIQLSINYYFMIFSVCKARERDIVVKLAEGSLLSNEGFIEGNFLSSGGCHLQFQQCLSLVFFFGQQGFMLNCLRFYFDARALIHFQRVQ
ncbi:hypothetical protein FGO68_gene4391 [Halteria grandinella]|uniref:Uncharacterized protein n=1 Tax=Halteria grandinella TaxID=5974 RepID=A0A8J8T8E3_HALGN|nr:hypothetical protein FGO68_gene4391 [Halteria grandinella]